MIQKAKKENGESPQMGDMRSWGVIAREERDEH